MLKDGGVVTIVKRVDFRVRESWVQILTLVTCYWATFLKLLYLSVPQFHW